MGLHCGCVWGVASFLTLQWVLLTYAPGSWHLMLMTTRSVMKYLQMYPHLPLILGSDGKGNIYWSVDAAFAVHNDMRGHTGAYMTLGQGTVVSISTKQKLNTKSSTECELVGVDEPLPMMLWARLFAVAQLMNVDGNVLYQDNISAIQMENNRKASCTKLTKHIDI